MPKLIAEAPPAGEHRMTLINVSQEEGKHGGQVYRFDFEDDQGRLAHKQTGVAFKLGESLVNFLEELAGKRFGREDEIEATDFLGQQFLVFMLKGSGNATYLAKIKPAKPAA